MGTPLDELIGLIGSFPIDCWASGPTAAALHGLDGYVLRPPFHITIERGHNLRRIGHHIHTTKSIDRLDRAWAHGLPVLSPTRTLLHLADMEPLERVVAALDGAVRDGLTSDDFLHRRIAALRVRGRGGVRPMLRALEGSEIQRGAQSWLEREFLRLAAASGLPRPTTQEVLGRRRTALIRVDCRFPGTNVVVELLGYRWHRTRPQLHIDVERTNALTLLGYAVIQFTYPQVVDDPDWVIATVRAALARATAA